MDATDDWRWTLGLLGIAGLALIPVVMAGSIAIRALIESRRERAAEARRVTLDIPGLGVFSTTDDKCWAGRAADLQIFILCSGRAPSAAQVEQVQSILRDLAKLAEKAEDYLRTNEPCCPSDSKAGFHPYSIEVSETPGFTLEVIHPDDPGGVYCVWFQNGEPSACGRDD